MRFRGAPLFAMLALVGGVASAEETATRAAPEPFYQLREAKLEYHGPSEDFANLSELRIGWFGPTDLNDPLTGDLWWATNQAVREANASADQPDTPSAPPPSNHKAARPALSSPPSSLTPSLPHSPSLPFRIVPRWADNPWNAGVSLLTRMVYDEQPLALLGSIDSASTHLAEQVVAKAQLPLVSPIATDPSVTLAGVSWMFACAPSDRAIARVLVDAVLQELGPRDREAVLFTTTDHESRMIAREVAQEFSRRGRLPAFRFELSPGTTELGPQLRAAAEAKPALVLIIAGVEDAARLIAAMRAELGNVPVFGNQTLGRTRFRELAGAAAEGVRFPLLFVPDPHDADTARFLTRFTAERGHEPDYTAALTYDATRLLITAIRRAGPNRARIREALAQLSPWSGVAGPITFDGTGQNTQPALRLGTIRDGAVVPAGSAGSYEPSGAVGSYEHERVAATSAHSPSRPHPSPATICTAPSP